MINPIHASNAPITQPMAIQQGQTKSAAAPASTTGSSGSTDTSTNSATTGIGSTFLNLLVQELQNQDPTAPMDSTAMVGQMISLNQLDQLISINQAVGGTSSTPDATTSNGAARSSVAAADALTPPSKSNMSSSGTAAALATQPAANPSHATIQQ
ncbi:flagellar hook capping FlgD N-terminal domain-containing protein [Granulicella sp. 5B5]|uniref:flagellar hook capping FlgD N-terminal domain-containing protein n=1 Tax=Granulicella sp. 5B5 TaxID=1617967 RepID=UPI002107F7D2|nr:flagellar hook capping FlgD N-terminal domain-containing protein [Granulicella sp. 5B5]